MRHGQGILRFLENGKAVETYQGQFNNGEFQGVGRYTYSNGDVYEGTFEHEKK